MSEPSGPPDFSAMMAQAQQLQERMLKAQEEIRKKTIEASAGGGMVTVVVSGGLEVLRLRIDPQVIDPKDPTMLQDLIIQAAIPVYQVRFLLKHNIVSMCDNISTQHYAVMDFPTFHRKMERAGIVV